TLQAFARAPFEGEVEKKQQRLGVQLDQPTRDTLAVLAGGRPVLIDLAVELGAQVTAKAWLNELKRDPAELRRLAASTQPADQSAFAAIQQRFDRELVASIAASEGMIPRLGSRIDQLTVLLALVAPLDHESIATILGLPSDQAGALFEEAGRRVSFKLIDNTLICLHDAVRDLVLAYVLPVVDPNRQLQQTYLAQAIDAFENQSHAILARVGRLRADEEIARSAGDRDRGLLLFEARPTSAAPGGGRGASPSVGSGPPRPAAPPASTASGRSPASTAAPPPTWAPCSARLGPISPNWSAARRHTTFKPRWRWPTSRSP